MFKISVLSVEIRVHPWLNGFIPAVYESWSHIQATLFQLPIFPDHYSLTLLQVGYLIRILDETRSVSLCTRMTGHQSQFTRTRMRHVCEMLQSLR